MLTVTGIDRLLEKIPALSDEIRRAGRNSVNATATYLKQQAIARISAETSLSKDVVKARISTKPSRQEEPFEAEVIASKKRLPLEEYSPTVSFQGTRGTVSADISMLRGVQVLRQAKALFANPAHPGRYYRRHSNKAFPINSNTQGPSVSHHFDRITKDLLAERH